MGTVKGQHRRPGRSAGANFGLALLVVALVGGAGAGGWYGYRAWQHRQTPTACPASAALTVAAAPELAPALQALAAGWNADPPPINGKCTRINVDAVAPADMAAAIASTAKVSVGGLGGANGSTTVPDVWIPDSSLWLQRLQDASPELAMTGTSIASSPVVVALPQPVAGALGGSAKPTWTSLLAKLQGGQLRPGIVDPNVDASGLAALLAVGGAMQAANGIQPGTQPTAAEASNAQAATIGAIRALAAGESELRDDLMGRFPRSADPTTIARSLSVAPVPEQSVLAYDAAKPPVPLAALYVDPAPPALDYPYTLMPGLTQDKAGAAQRFQALLAGTAWRDRLASAQLRAPDGTFGAAMPKLPGMPATVKPDTDIPGSVVDSALSTWSAVTVPGRLLAVIDVSGSMATPVPSAGGASREQVTVAAAKAGLGLFDDQWTVGLWTFSTKLTGTLDYRELVPIEPLSAGRPAMAGALTQIRPVPGGQTGLYDTVLAAYKAVQKDWDPSRVNSVVIMTDGQNQDPAGLTLNQLLDQLNQIKDPKRPIQVIAIGIGNDVSKAELQKITDATGGGTFTTTDPSNIGEIFLKAIALRPGTAK